MVCFQTLLSAVMMWCGRVLSATRPFGEERWGEREGETRFRADKGAMDGDL